MVFVPGKCASPNEKVSNALKKLFFTLINSLGLRNLSFHSELGFGVAAGFNATFGFKVALDVQAILKWNLRD